MLGKYIKLKILDYKFNKYLMIFERHISNKNINKHIRNNWKRLNVHYRKKLLNDFKSSIDIMKSTTYMHNETIESRTMSEYVRLSNLSDVYYMFQCAYAFSNSTNGPRK